MNFIDLAKSRYTTKKYDSSKRIDNETIETLKEILRLSPSSINSQPWKFTFVGDGETKNKLAEQSRYNRNKVLNSSHTVVFSVCKDSEVFEKERLSQLSEGTIDYYENYMKSISEGDIRVWMRSQVYIALGYFLCACASMGIDSTPMEGIESAEYDKILGDDNYKALFAVAIGYRDKDDTNQPDITPKSRLERNIVIRDL